MADPSMATGMLVTLATLLLELMGKPLLTSKTARFPSVGPIPSSDAVWWWVG